MKIFRLPLALAVLSLLLLAGSGVGVRLGWWVFPVGFSMLRWVVYCGVAAAIFAVIGLAVPRWRSAGLRSLLLALVIGGGAAAIPFQMAQQAKILPRIHDVSTDLSDPPAFVAVLPMRADAANPAAYGGAEVAAAQRQGYPDVAPLMLSEPVATAYARALAAARKSGWDIVSDSPQSGRIEATATTMWFGFKDDVVVRIRPDGNGSRIDVRSVSRVGKSDVGANAKRIRQYLELVAAK